MKSLNFNLTGILTAIALIIIPLTSCSDDNGQMVNITVNEGPLGDIGGDFTGNGGSGSRTINWVNNLSTADFNADITATQSGIFQIIVQDSKGKVVLDRTLNGATEPDSIDGVTSVGDPGIWTITITLTSFNGDGSYSLSAGD
jgi:hypothetical protein